MQAYDPQQLLPLTYVAELLTVCRSTVDRYVRLGMLKTIKRRGGYKYKYRHMVLRSELERFMYDGFQYKPKAGDTKVNRIKSNRASVDRTKECLLPSSPNFDTTQIHIG